jgi:hypothetical protein
MAFRETSKFQITFAAADLCTEARSKRLVSVTFWPLYSLGGKNSIMHLTQRLVGLSAVLILLSNYIHALRKIQFQLCRRCTVAGYFCCLYFNPLTPELNSSAQRYLTRLFTRDFSSWTVHFVNVCVQNQQMQQLFIQFNNYVWYLLPVSALHCHPQGAFPVPSERCSIEEQSIEYCGRACCV